MNAKIYNAIMYEFADDIIEGQNDLIDSAIRLLNHLIVVDTLWRFSLYVLVNTLIPPDNHDFVSSRRCSFILNQAK